MGSLNDHSVCLMTALKSYKIGCGNVVTFLMTGLTHGHNSRLNYGHKSREFWGLKFTHIKFIKHIKFEKHRSVVENNQKESGNPRDFY